MNKNDKNDKKIQQEKLKKDILSLFVNLTDGQAIILKNYCESLSTYEDLKNQKKKLDDAKLKNETTTKAFNQTTKDNENLEQEIIKLRAKDKNYGLKSSDMKNFVKLLNNFNKNLIKLQVAIKQLNKRYKGPDKTK